MKRATYIILIAVAILGIATAYSVFGPVLNPDAVAYIYIDDDDTADSVNAKIRGVGHPTTLAGLSLMQTVLGYDSHVRSGRYAIEPGMSAFTMMRDLRNGHQAPLQLTIPTTRTLDQLADVVAGRLKISAEDMLRTLRDDSVCASIGFSPATLPALFIPNTYEIYWDISADDFVRRMKREHDAFWTDERRQQADRLGLTTQEVTTLASIVDAETTYAPEKPSIAALYLNRLRKGMLLQSDPTVIFGIGDFSIQRVKGNHLLDNSPYNTYKFKGLPPGPIRIASIEAIDAVLHPDSHAYLYMCAKEDFSGSHRFATTYAEHQRNAQLYLNALNARGIR